MACDGKESMLSRDMPMRLGRTRRRQDDDGIRGLQPSRVGLRWYQLRQRDGVESAGDGVTNPQPHAGYGAARLTSALDIVMNLTRAHHGGNGSLQRSEDMPDGDFLRGPAELISSPCTMVADQKTRLPQASDKLLQVG